MKRITVAVIIMLSVGCFSFPLSTTEYEQKGTASPLYLPFIAGQPMNLLSNPDFEEDEWHYSVYWDARGGPHWVTFEEVRPPVHWIAFWYEGIEGICTGSVPGRPEFSVFEKHLDPRRVLTGNKAAKYFTFWRCQKAGLMQPVRVPAGRYIASAFIQVWYSDCSDRPYDPPLDKYCKRPLGARLKVQMGIDPLGGLDPAAESVIWGEARAAYGEFVKIESPVVEVDFSGEITVFILSKSDYALKHEDVYIDGAVLVGIP